MNRRERSLAGLSVSLTFALGLAACQGGGGGVDTEAAAEGVVHVFLTDAPINKDGHEISQVLLAVERVDILFSDDRPHASIPVGKTIDVLKLRNGVNAELGNITLPSGIITEVRLILSPDGAAAVVDGEIVHLELPSGEQTGLKLKAGEGFEIRPNLTTIIVLDFDAERSLHFAPGQGWMLTPVAQLVEAPMAVGITQPAPDATVSRNTVVRGTIVSKEPLASLTVNGGSTGLPRGTSP